MSYKINGRTVVKPPEGFINVINTKSHKGMAYEYIVNAVAMLGRPLNKGEVVHHIDCNKDNNSPDNLMVFRSKTDHSMFHKNGLDVNLLIDNKDGTFSVDRSMSCSLNKFICTHCGKAFNERKLNRKHNKVFCSLNCYMDYKRRNVPNKETLEELVKNTSLTGIGRIYGVSCNSVKKWCIRYNIDYKVKNKE
jgi:hypothetical protein